MERIEKCYRCGSEQLIKGTLVGMFGPAQFRPDNLKFMAIQLRSHVMTDGDSIVCIDCGLLCSTVDADKARKLAENVKK